MMRTSSIAPNRPGGISLFSRLLGLLVAVMLLLQLADFSMVYFSRLPAAHIYEIDDIASTLASGTASKGLRVFTGAPPSDGQEDDRDQRLGLILARQLGVASERVRVRVSSPPQIFPRRSKDRSESDDLERSKVEERLDSVAIDNGITGRFVAAMRTPQGTWRIARPPYGLEPWHWQALGGLLVAILAALPIAWLMARRVTRPIQLFADAADRIGSDPGAPPVRVEGPPEIRHAAQTINSLQERIRRFVDDRTILVGHIAHDMASPLMRIQLLEDQMPPTVRANVDAEISEMRDRIRDTLAFVKNVSHSHRKRQRLRLRSLLESLSEELGQDIELVEGPDPIVFADVAGLRALFRNLLANAVTYGRHASISLTVQGRDVLVSITDRGPGMLAEELVNAFQPFCRGSAARDLDIRGTGLGLASARAIARSSGGEITLANRKEGGLEVRVTLPQDEADRADCAL